MNIPGFGPFKGNPKENAKQAGKKASELTSSAKSTLGYMHVGELAFDLPSLPGSNVKKTDLPDGPKPLSGTLDIGGGSDIAGQVFSYPSCLYAPTLLPCVYVSGLMPTQVFDLPSLPGSNLNKTHLPDGLKPLSGMLDIGGGSDIAG